MCVNDRTYSVYGMTPLFSPGFTSLVNTSYFLRHNLRQKSLRCGKKKKEPDRPLVSFCRNLSHLTSKRLLDTEFF